jgi:hypothetical protein
LGRQFFRSTPGEDGANVVRVKGLSVRRQDILDALHTARIFTPEHKHTEILSVILAARQKTALGDIRTIDIRCKKIAITPMWTLNQRSTALKFTGPPISS